MAAGELDVDYFARRFVPAFAPLAAYHRFELVGGEHTPRSGPAIFALTHSAATYEAFLLMRAVYQATGRVVRGLGDRVWFRVPLMAARLRRVGFIVADPAGARDLLDAGELIGVAPGGMFEALRPSSERFRVRWSGRTGFARLALATGAPIVLGACPGADLIFDVRASRISDWGYRRLKLPLFVMRGLGPTLLPRPARLRFHLDAPIAVARVESPSPAQVAALHAEVAARMARLIERAVRADGLG
jgi:1-acyl-sn-glycerol-3-phosphate acyltransferase